MTSSGRNVLDRIISIHREGCEALGQLGAGFVRDEGTEAEIASSLMTLRKPFEGARRLVGQVGGLLLLAESAGQRELVDIAAFQIAKDQWAEFNEELRAIRPEAHLQWRFQRLVAAMELIGECLEAIQSAAKPQSGIDLQPAMAKINAAYRQVQSVSDPSRGLGMVDFTQACCTCHTPLIQLPT